MPDPVNPPVQPDPNNPSPFKPPPQPTPAIPQPKGDDGPLGEGVLEGLRRFWRSINRNPIVVAFEGGAYGAILDFIDDGLTSGHLDFSRPGLHKLASLAILGGLTAVRLLYRPAPGTNPKP